MHVRTVVASVVIILLVTTILAGLENGQVTGSTILAALSTTSATPSTETIANSDTHAAGTTAATQRSLVGAGVAHSVKKYIVFRDDDVSARSLQTLQAVNQVHIDENVPVTLAVIPHPDANGTGNELLAEPLHSYLLSLQGNSLFELAQHGYNHDNYVQIPAGTAVQESLDDRRPDANLDGAANRSEFRGRPYVDQYAAIIRGRNDIHAAFGVTPRTFVPPFNTGDNNTLNALNVLGFTLYSTSPDDFQVKQADLQGILVQGKTFGLGWKNDSLWKWRMQNLTQYTDAALDAAAPGDSIVVYYHYWTFNRPDGSPDYAHISLFKHYIEHLKGRGDVLFTTLGDQLFLKTSSAAAVSARDANSLDVYAQNSYYTFSFLAPTPL